MQQNGSGWKNWGDHPLIVSLTVLVGIVGILTPILTTYGQNITGITRYALFVSLFLAIGIAIGIITGWRLHYKRTSNILRVRSGKYDSDLEYLHKCNRIDMLAINFAGFFNFSLYVRKAVFENNAIVRVLLSDTEGEAFQVYCKKHNDHDPKGLVENRNKTVQTILDLQRQIIEQNHNPDRASKIDGSISYEFFDSIPYRGCIVSDTVVRYWPYLEHLHPSASPTYDVARNGEIGIALANEFEHVWKESIHKRQKRYWPVEQIISGGQIGVDRAALDWSISHCVSHSGWCPKGRKAEDGIIDSKYNLKETSSEQYEVRTRKNIEDSDGTIIFSKSLEINGGTLLTLDLAKQLQKPWLHLVEADRQKQWEDELLVFVLKHNIKRLNIAGPRASQEPGLEAFVTDVLTKTWIQAKNIT